MPINYGQGSAIDAAIAKLVRQVSGEAEERSEFGMPLSKLTIREIALMVGMTVQGILDYGDKWCSVVQDEWKFLAQSREGYNHVYMRNGAEFQGDEAFYLFSVTRRPKVEPKVSQAAVFFRKPSDNQSQTGMKNKTDE